MNTYLTLDEIVRAIISEEDSDPREYARIMGIVIRGYKKVYIKYLPNMKTVSVPINSAKVASLPVDYVENSVKAVGVGFTNNNGNDVILALSVDNDLLTPENTKLSDHCDCPETPTTSAETIERLREGWIPFPEMFLFRNVWRNGNYVGELYGYRNGISPAGTYKVDEEEGVVVFGADIPTYQTHAFITYKSTGLSYGPDTKVPHICEGVLTSYGRWKRLNTRNSSGSDRRIALMEHIGEIEDMTAYLERMNVGDFYEMMISTSGLV